MTTDAKPVKQGDERQRPSVGDITGRPPSGNNGTFQLAPLGIQVTKDKLDWLVSGILNEDEYGPMLRMLVKNMQRVNGRVPKEQLIFTAIHLRRSVQGAGLDMFERIAVGEQKVQLASRQAADFVRQWNTSPPQQQQPSEPQR